MIGAGHRPPRRAVEDEDGERRQPVEGRPLARLGGEEVAPLLAGEPGDDDAADAHRPGPRQRLGVDPRADHEDRSRPSRRRGRPGAARRRARPRAEPAARRAAEGDDAADPATGGADRDRGARPDLADDPGDRGLERVDDVAGRDAPAALPREEELAARGAARTAGVAAPRPARARASDRRVAARPARGTTCPRGAGRAGARRSGAPTTTDSPGLDQGPVARREREDGIDRATR